MENRLGHRTLAGFVTDLMCMCESLLSAVSASWQSLCFVCGFLPRSIAGVICMLVKSALASERDR